LIPLLHPHDQSLTQQQPHIQTFNMTPITKLLPLFALLATLANASIDPRADETDSMRAQTQEYDQPLKADIDQPEYQHRRSVGDELAKDIKEDPSYCGPAGSPVSPHPTPRPTQLTFSNAMSFNPTTPSPSMIMITTKSMLETALATQSLAVGIEEKVGSVRMDRTILKQ
jgi:hypothetical protein